MNADLKRLQGSWSIDSLEIDGGEVSGAALAGARITVHGDHFTSTGMGAEYEGTIEVHAAARPKTFNLNFTTGPEKGRTNFGIYEFEGDAWRICINTRGKTRPKKFASEPGTGIAVELLRRAGESPPMKAAAHPEKMDGSAGTFNLEDVKFEPAPELAGKWSMVSGALDGHALDKNLVRVGTRVVAGNDMTVAFGQEVYSKAKYTVDRSQTPTAIDIYNTHGANTGKVQYGIYELGGNTLKLCIAAPGRERPSDFLSTPGDGRTLVFWSKKSK